ncbi:SgcJ/EcaC family oxidoreductase [Sciscionella marina]|uniref:SgcJ/EcaC family oxidoreductase n=1 Tax=Sciscionella marina TaxID=508770 RepID=UPI00037F66D1|nr:SgcJ/EcaC family oxidoreductase [Sciscionella marina]
MSEATTTAQVLELYREAWDSGDASAFGNLFTEDATYVIFTGHALCGRKQIQNDHHEVFTRWQKGTRLLVEALQTTMLDDNTAVILTQGGIGTESIEFDKFQTFTLVRREERWFIAAFQNTEMSAHADIPR